MQLVKSSLYYSFVQCHSTSHLSSLFYKLISFILFLHLYSILSPSLFITITIYHLFVIDFITITILSLSQSIIYLSLILSLSESITYLSLILSLSLFCCWFITITILLLVYHYHYFVAGLSLSLIYH